MPDTSTPPPHPLPSTDEIRALLRPLDFFERYVNGQHEGDVYVDTHASRFRETLRMLPGDLGPRPGCSSSARCPTR